MTQEEALAGTTLFALLTVIIILVLIICRQAGGGPTIQDLIEDLDCDTDSTATSLRGADPGADGSTAISTVLVRPKALRITGCSDPSMWYAGLVGQEVPFLGIWHVEGYHSREPAGYSNIVKFRDAEVIYHNKEGEA